jgi:hypothetical protein
MRNRVPIVYLVDSAGVDLPYQDRIFPGASANAVTSGGDTMAGTIKRIKPGRRHARPTPRLATGLRSAALHAPGCVRRWRSLASPARGKPCPRDGSH